MSTTEEAKAQDKGCMGWWVGWEEGAEKVSQARERIGAMWGGRPILGPGAGEASEWEDGDSLVSTADLLSR